MFLWTIYKTSSKKFNEKTEIIKIVLEIVNTTYNYDNNIIKTTA